MRFEYENASRQRAIAPGEMAPEEASELLSALRRSQPTPEAVALNHLMPGEHQASGAEE
jgi:hypothetical protein